MKDQSWSAASSPWLGPALIFFGALAYFGLFVGYGLNLDDEGVLLAQYYRTFAGEVPVRDFHIGYTPGGYYLNAALFWLLGPTVISLRWGLAFSNALVAALLFGLGRRALPQGYGLFGLIAPLLYCSVIPFYGGQFATFNIPYPAWYGVSLWLLGLWAQLRFFETRSVWLLVLSGLTAGLCFSVKPNVGLFQLAMHGLVFLALFEPPLRNSDGEGDAWDTAAWWALLVGVTGGLGVVFASRAGWREFSIFLLPLVLVLGALGLRRARGVVSSTAQGGLLRDSLIFAASFLVPIIPWVVGFLWMLGPQRFLRSLFFVGSGFEHFYFETFHQAGLADLALVLGVLGLLVVVFSARSSLLSPRMAMAGLLAGGVSAVALLCLAPMPEGLHAAVVSASEDLSFTVSLLVHWGALALALPLLLTRERHGWGHTQVALLLGALTMYLQLYPRSDFPHLIFAMPLTLVVGAGLLAKLVKELPLALGVRATASAAVVGAVVVFSIFRVTPNLSSVLAWNNGPSLRAHAEFDLARAPISLERGREHEVRSLKQVVAYLETNLGPEEATFTFPAIEVLCFLSDRVNATRHGYFFPGWPGHEVEAEVITSLAANPPRLVVALSSHQFFFSTAPLYYYALREFLGAHYEEVARFGEFSVLAHHDVDRTQLRMPSSTLEGSATALGRGLEADYGAWLSGDEATKLRTLADLGVERLSFAWPPAIALLSDPSSKVRRASIDAFASADDPEVALALAKALARGHVASDQRLRVIRQIWTTGDPRVLATVARVFRESKGTPEYGPLMAALDANAAKLVFSDYWLGKRLPEEADLSDFPTDSFWRERLADPEENIIFRTLLAGLLSRVDGAASIPALRQAATSPRVYLRGAAIEGLLYLGVQDGRDQFFDDLVAAVAEEATYSPSMLLKLYRDEPELYGVKLGQALFRLSPSDSDSRVALTWVAAATADPVFTELFKTFLKDSDAHLRMAALAGLERIGGPALEPALTDALQDEDYEIRIFAERVISNFENSANRASSASL